MFNKSKVNFVIDALMFLCMIMITGMGLLMKYVLVPGRERWVEYGSNVELYLLGMDRHEWGTVHLTIGLILLGLLALHIILHWRMIVNLFRRLIGSQGMRTIIAVIFIIACVFFVISPFMVSPEIQDLARGERHYRIKRGYLEDKEETTKQPAKRVKDLPHESHRHVESSIEVRGYMTLAEVAEKHKVPLEYLKRQLNLPEFTPSGERLGLLRKRYGFRMSEVEKIINEYHRTK